MDLNVAERKTNEKVEEDSESENFKDFNS